MRAGRAVIMVSAAPAVGLPAAAETVLAALPIVLLLVLMIWRRWSAARAGATTAACTALVALTVFDLGAAAGGVGQALLGTTAEALFVASTIGALLLPALALHRVQDAAGAVVTLRRRLVAATGDRFLAAFVVAWFFALFVEGAAGFGTPVALAAPLLVGLGVPALPAVVASLAGHAAGVSFGAVGTPLLAQLGLSDADATELTRATATYHAAVSWTFAFFVVAVIGAHVPGRRGRWRWAALAAAAFLLPFVAIAWFVGAELATMGGALCGVAVFLAVTRLGRPAAAGGAPGAEGPDDAGGGSLRLAVAPYAVLVGAIAVTRLVAPVRDALRGVEWRWELPGGFSGSVQPLYHPAVVLAAAVVTAILAGRAPWRQAGAAVAAAAGQVGRAMIGLVSVLLVARLMSRAGMTDELAATAALTGAAWPLIAPLVGALGTFVTGSATSSNVLFTEFHEATAVEGDLDVPALLGAQGFGAAVGNVVCPHNIVAASATVGVGGHEGLVLRRTGALAAVALAGGGLVALLLA